MTQYHAKWPNKAGMIDWSDTENKTWHQLITRQYQVVQNRACNEFITGLDNLKLSSDFVPQLVDVNKNIQPNYFILENLEQLFKLQSDPLLLQLIDINDDAVQDTFIT